MVSHCPISSKAWRVQQRYLLYQKAVKQKRPDYPTARGLLLDVARELDQIKPDQGSGPASVTINLALVNQVRALPAEAQETYLRTGKLPPESYLLDVTAGKPGSIKAASPVIEAEIVPESDDQEENDTKAKPIP